MLNDSYYDPGTFGRDTSANSHVVRGFQTNVADLPTFLINFISPRNTYVIP